MNYIIFDMEWNQPFSKESAIQSPIYLSGEIIQIGAIKMDSTGRAVDCLDLMIAPTFYKKLHYRIKKMTGIDQAALKGQPKFKEAIEQFREWCGEDCILFSWGYDDIQMMRDNLLMHDLEEDWLPPCLNLQGIYNRQVSHENRQFSLETAMETLGLEAGLHAHNAFNDAIYTARVARCLNLKEGVRNYEELNGVLYHSMHSQKTFFPHFRNKQMALEDPALKKVPCPICGKILKVRSFTQDDEKNYSAEISTHHAILSVKLKLMQTRHKAFYIKRTVRFL